MKRSGGLRISSPLVACLAGAAVATPACAGGFAVQTQSVSALGNALAATAAADDASTIWLNPAGMSLLPGRVNLAGSLHAYAPSNRYHDSGSSGVFAAAGTGDGGDAARSAVVPQFYVSARLPILDGRVVAGVGINAPFGMKTEYDPGWRGNMNTIRSETESVNINPSIAVQLADGWSVGVGINLQRFSTELALMSVAGPLRVTAKDTAVGYNVGILRRGEGDVRVGAAYRSAIGYDLGGNATYAAVPFLDAAITARMKVPETLSVHAFAPVGQRWEWMLDVTFTRWNRLGTIDVMQVSGPAAGQILAPLVYEWRNTRTVGIGANYKPNADARTKLRLGVGYDQTPTRDSTRGPDLPDEDALAFTFGVHRREPLGLPGSIDASIMFLRIKDAAINTSTLPATPGSALVGKVKNRGVILGIQYSNSF